MMVVFSLMGVLTSYWRLNLLTQNGIREPLYLTTLRQLGVDLAKEEQLANFGQLVYLKRSGSAAE